MDVLNLSQNVIKSLSTLDSYPTEQITKLCRVFLQKLVLGTSSNLDEKTNILIDSIGSVLLDAARTKSAPNQLKALMNEQGLTGDSVDVLVGFYTQHQDTIVSYLSKIGISFPQIVGIDWRIDYAIRSKTTGKENAPMFYVSLKVLENNDKINNVNFIASLEEMHDLLAKVRDAVKQVERVLTTESH